MDQELGQGPVEMAHLCHLSSMAPSFSMRCSPVGPLGSSISLILPSAGSSILGCGLRVSVSLVWPLHVVPSEMWLEFSHGSSRISNKYKQKWLILKAQAWNCQSRLHHLLLVRAGPWASPTQGRGQWGAWFIRDHLW